jgi:hypothetical protein
MTEEMDTVINIEEQSTTTSQTPSRCSFVYVMKRLYALVLCILMLDIVCFTISITVKGILK